MKRIIILLFFFLITKSWLYSQTDYFDFQEYKNQRIAERLFNKAVEAVNAKDYYGALYFLDSVTLLQPNMSKAYIERGKIYYLKERPNDALNEFRQVLTFEPLNGEAIFYKAYVMFYRIRPV